MKSFLFIVLSVILLNSGSFSNFIFAQGNSLTGLPIIKNYLPSEHGGTPQNWEIVKDKRGIIYFANTGGLLEYDGSNWRLIKVENEVARSVAMDSRGTIFVGGVDQFGLLKADTTGKLQYKSLLKLLPAEERNFGDIWTIWPVENGIYFQSSSHIFYLPNSLIYSTDRSQKGIRIWKSESVFSPAFMVDNKFYVPEIGKGLCAIEEDEIKMIKEGDKFNGITIYSMLSFNGDYSSDKRVLIGTEKGFFVYDNNTISKIKTEADGYIIQNQLYFRGAILSNNTFAFGTQNGGMFVLNKSGKLLSIINKSLGLNDNTVWFVYPGYRGELWLGLNNGIARINYPSSLTLFDSHFGLDGTLYAFNEHNGKMFVTSANGVYYAEGNPGLDYKSTFKKIENISSESWEIISLDDYQLVGTTNGVFKITGIKAEQIKSNWRFAYSLCKSQSVDNLIYVGLHDGLATLQLINETWKDFGKIPGVSDIIYHIVEENDGTLWLSTFNKGLIRVIPHQNGQNSSYSISRFGKEQGISEKVLIPVKLGTRIIFVNSEGFIWFDKNDNSFKNDNNFGDYFENGYRVADVSKDINGNIWILGGKNKSFELSKITINGDETLNRKSFPILNTIVNNDFYSSPYRLYLDKETADILWITASDKLYKFDVSLFSQESAKTNYLALIREVKTDGDSIIYYGGFNEMSGPNEMEWRLKPNLSSIEFSYSVSSYINESAHWYKYYLKGFNNSWSEWTKETRKEYTNLPSGNFIFKVKAMNAMGEISQEASFKFHIPSPWYQSWWAVFIYILIFLSAIWLFINYRLKYLEKRTVELESIVNERTREVRKQKETLEEQAKKLVELDRLKTNFFTNISHEFRTPLTLVMGQIENILDSTTEEKVKAKLKMALSNSKRLHSLINQLLELSRLEAGEIKLKVSEVEIISFLKKVFSAFESYAERKNVELKFTPGQEKVHLYSDREKLEEIFNNLISNAIKFTPDAGMISLKISERKDNNDVEIIIEDTGVGINEESLPHIFDRFYQVDGSQTRKYEGTGIGLAIVKELVDLHQGVIKVESLPDKGTTFKIYLKKGKSHFQDKSFVEIIDKKGISSSEKSYRTQMIIEELDQNGESEDIGIKDKEVVLVVEDNAEMRNYIQEQLSENFNVLLAKNGEEGIKNAYESIPDLIITDVMMPIINGYDLAIKLKNDKRTSHIPIIMLTAKADEESKLKGLEIGVDDYLIKPFSRKELYARVGNLIKLRVLLKERYKGVSAINFDKIDVKPLEQEFLEKVFNSIKENLENPQFGVTFLAEEVGLSVSQLNRKLNALINQSAGKLIRATKLDYAAQLLKKGAGNISEIAYRVGFSDTPGFSHSFKEKFGCTPSEYLKT